MYVQSLEEIKQEYGMAVILKKSIYNELILGETFLTRKMTQCYLFMKLFIKDAQLTKKSLHGSSVT